MTRERTGEVERHHSARCRSDYVKRRESEMLNKSAKIGHCVAWLLGRRVGDRGARTTAIVVDASKAAGDKRGNLRLPALARTRTRMEKYHRCSGSAAIVECEIDTWKLKL
jgi:hypothetical protein